VSIPDGAPTGQVFNATTTFHVSGGGVTVPARFIFASENGSIDAWSNALPPAPPKVAQSMVTVPGAVYKGLALGISTAGPRLYAADFHHGRVQVFDGSFQPVDSPGAFVDPHLPARYAPFNVAVLAGRLYVSYAMQDAVGHDDVAGQGHGFVDVYDLDGRLVRRLVSRGRLDSPWGMALAPAGFGSFSGDLLVGNFGDGRIDAYDPMTGEFAGVLMWRPGKPIVIDGLWGLLFGNGVAGSPTTLLFSAGPDREQHGLFGTITLAP
ncbi:MAG TPA: TIGR03118 family protein, partial [Candidatus Dormibacteraeota bacterium]|nr:TIGR03118 family protein [Candidatus Dormibacteraeota bacterium]